jgi:hypothetical protein
MAYLGNTPSQQAFAPAVDYFNGNASTVAFTLSRPVASVAQVQVTIENVPQNPSSAFTVSGSTITFTSAPPSGTSNIYVQYTSPITTVIAPGQGTVNTTQLGSITTIPNGAATLTLPTGTDTLVGKATTDTLTNKSIAATQLTGTIAAAVLPTGSVLQRVNFQTGAVATGTTIIPNDDTIPQITEGNQYMSLAITPTSATSTLEIVVTLFGTESTNVSDLIVVALFKDSNADAIACGSGPSVGTTLGPSCHVFTHSQSAASTSTQTFSVRAGMNAAGTFVFNGGAGTGRKFGGVLASSIKITEIAA